MLETTSRYIEEEKLFHGFIPRIMGTRFDVLLSDVDLGTGNKCWSQIVNELQRLEKMMNRFDPTSEVSRLNVNASKTPTTVSNELWFILQECKKYHQLTNGLFDITLSDFHNIEFHTNIQSVSFTKGISLDFGGFAKGYALEKIKEILRNENVENAFIDFGNSSILAIGKHPYGDSWKASVVNPFIPGNILKEFALKNSSLTTSGNTPSYTGHIINPASGKQCITKKCVCIVTNNASEGEVLSTALMVAHEEEKQEIIKNFKTEQIIEFNL